MDSCELVFQCVGNSRFSMPGCRATRKNAAAGQGRTFWQYATKKLAAGIEPPSSSRPRLRFLLRCFAPESARGAARSKRMAAAPSAAASAGGVSQGHGRAFSLLIPSCRPVQALAASQELRSAMPSKSNRASARASSLSSGRLRITLSCSALKGPQRRLSRRRVTLASPWT